MTAVSKEAGARWREMDEEARKPYDKKYKELYKTYTDAMSEFRKSLSDDAAAADESVDMTAGVPAQASTETVSGFSYRGQKELSVF